MIMRGYTLGDEGGRTIYPYANLDGKFVEVGVQCMGQDGEPADVGAIMVTADTAIELGKMLIQVGHVARLAEMLTKAN